MKHALLALVIAACGGSSTPAQSPQPPAPPPAEAASETPVDSDAPAPGDDVVAQAELAEQYELGKQVYTDKACDTCHGARGEGNPKNPAVIGEGALPAQAPKAAKLRKGITFTTAKDVLDFVQAKMPIKTPGTLTDEEAAAVTSWMLSESKVEISRKLDASNAASIQLR